ncbi:unnamed protein product [Orchesella dallaii]|uniref:Uncharacterized protein n=1 Tax=Orchesella dallaii TaxID=48710 RepID=A0ABP1QFX2_9HEXA
MFYYIVHILVLLFGCVIPQQNADNSVATVKHIEKDTVPKLQPEIPSSIPSENPRTKRQFVLVPTQYLNTYPAQPNPYPMQPLPNMNQNPPQQVQPISLDSRILQEVAIELLRVIEPLLETAAALNQSASSVSSASTNTS